MPKGKTQSPAEASCPPVRHPEMTPDELFAYHCETNFEFYTMADAQECDLWDMVSVETSRDDQGNVVITVSLDPSFEVTIPRDAEPQDWHKVAAGEYVARKLHHDFRELQKVVEHRVDFALLTDPPKRLCLN